MVEHNYSSKDSLLKPGDPVVFIGTFGKSLKQGVVLRCTPKGYTVGNKGDTQGLSRRFDQVVPLK